MAERLRWVEFYGGPNDGDMEELPVYLVNDPGPRAPGVLVQTPEQTGPNTFIGHTEGWYRPRTWADEDLGVVRMHWDHRKVRPAA